MYLRIVVAVVAVLGMALYVPAASAGGPYSNKPPAPLDESLMAFKEHGVWYDFCEAPAFAVRIPPHYATYGPPPPPCCPIPVGVPLMRPPIKVK